MGAAFFFHLTERPLEATLPVLIDKALSRGWRIVVRGRDPERMAWLDEKLWLTPEDGFLPHGLAGGEHDADQPVLLAAVSGLTEDRACLMSIDGAEVAPDEIAGLERVCILFDGHDGEAVARAREQWRAVTGAGCAAQYWSEAGGRWEKKAESGPEA